MISLIAAAALHTVAPRPASSTAIAVPARLRTIDQALLDALAPGDRSLWARTLTADAIYVDENGVVMDRARFLKELTPLPKGASGHIAIVKHQVRVEGDTALVLHWDDEREDFHGQNLHADYLMSETWLRRAGQWRLALVHVYVVAKDPPAISVPASALEAFVGRYRAAPDLVYVVRRDGDRLLGGREGASEHELLAEFPDVFFVAGQPRTRRFFIRDASGKVVKFIDRREGEDIIWTRIEAPQK